MTHNLADTCDTFLKKTGILSRKYGIPDITKYNVENYDNKHVLSEEKHYHELHSLFLEKVEELLYLKSLEKLKHETAYSIDQKFSKLVKENSQLIKLSQVSSAEPFDTDRLRTIKDSLEKHNANVKKEFIGKFLQVLLPILRSIHNVDFGITSSEAKISYNLSQLYSNKEVVDSVNINSLIKRFNSRLELNEMLSTITAETEMIYNELLVPKIEEHSAIVKKVESSRRELMTKKRAQLAGLSVEKTDIKSVLETLITEWAYISILSDFIQSFIVTLPIDWYLTKSLKSILQKCEEISSRVAKYQLVLNFSNLDNYNDTELLLIDFDELIQNESFNM